MKHPNINHFTLNSLLIKINSTKAIQSKSIFVTAQPNTRLDSFESPHSPGIYLHIHAYIHSYMFLYWKRVESDNLCAKWWWL